MGRQMPCRDPEKAKFSPKYGDKAICAQCQKEIEFQKTLGLGDVWQASDGVFCKTSEDRKSLTKHIPLVGRCCENGNFGDEHQCHKKSESGPSGWYMKPCPKEIGAMMTPPADWSIVGPNGEWMYFSSEELEKLAKGHLQIIPLERLKDLRDPAPPSFPAGPEEGQ